MTVLELLRDPVWQRVALVLLHFVWQGALIAIVLGALLWLLRVRSPQVRYAAWLCGLILMAGCPAATFVLTETVANVVSTESVAAEAAAVVARDSTGETALAFASPSAAKGLWEHVTQTVEHRDRLMAVVAPYLVLFWLVGVGLFGGRLLLGFAGVHRLACGRRNAEGELLRQAVALAERMGLRRAPRVAVCARAREALALGFVRPMILLPAAWVTELPPDVLRAVLAHELAHVRRWDVWVNLLQRVIETLLFYHPAVWWVSRRVRAERELCCDDLAVRGTGGRVEYAQALECVAQRRLAESSPLLAAGIGGRKMALLRRVRHVLGTEPDGASRAGRWSAGLIALAVPPALWLSVSVLAPPVVGQEEREREVREREREESPEARERQREREARPARGRDSRFEPEFEQALRDAQLRRGMTRLYTDPEEFEQAIREAQRQAREAEERAEEARRRAEEMMRRVMQRRDERTRPGNEREHDARDREGDRPGPEEFRDMTERRMRLRAEGFGPGGPPVPGLVEEIRRLREEVEQLRREVEQMRQGPRGGPFGGAEGFRERMERMRQMRDPFGVRPPSPPDAPDRPRVDRDRDRARDEEGRERERRGEDVPARFRGRRPDRPLPPPGLPDAARGSSEREERRDENRREEARDPAGDEARERAAPEADTAEAQGARQVVVSYPVGDLAVMRDGLPDIDPLKQVVEQASGIGTGIPGIVRQHDATLTLVVRTTDGGHAHVRQLLTSLRQQADQEQTSSEELPPTAPSEDTSRESD